MNISKDFIKFRQYVRSLSLSVNEQYLLEYFFEYTNTDYGYAFPTFEQIMQAFSTTSKNRISSTIKKLEKKGVLRVDRNYSNNRYYVIGIENFINQANTKPKDSDGKPPLNGQVHFSELTTEEAEIINATNFTQNQAKSLLQLCDNKVDKLISTIQYAIKNKANNVFGYVKALLVRDINIETKEEYKSNYSKKSISFVDNCSSRNYSEEWYKSTEERLLGWA
jgi:SOS-response transcriptional repressor LexA